MRGSITSISVNPNLALTLAVDKSTAIPGDTLAYSGTVTHTGITACVNGSLSAQNTGGATATVADFFDEIDYWDPNALKWVPLAGVANTQTAFVPVVTPRISTGITITVTGVPANGVTYPSSGNPIVGTKIASGATAAWTGSICITLTAAQLNALFNAPKLRVEGHLEDTPGDPSGESWTNDQECFNPLRSGFLNARNVVVTVTPPSGPSIQITSSTVPAFSSLAPGASANYATTYRVPAATSRGSSETEAAYLLRLTHLEGSSLKASASVTANGPTGPVSANAPPVTTIEHLPIVTISKSGPATVAVGTTATYPLALNNVGGAAATGIVIADTVPGGANGTVSGNPGTLAAGASSTGVQATFPVPVSQSSGNLTDTATVNWLDANGNAYGSLSSAFTTVVQNTLQGARLTLALPPGSAGLNPVNGSQVVLISLVNSAGSPIPGQLVTVNVTGVNPTTLTATTDANGLAIVTYSGKMQGVDQLQAIASSASTTVQSNTITVTWIAPIEPVSTTPAQGTFFAESAAAQTFVAKPGDPAAFQQTFPTINFNPPANTIPHNVSGVDPTTRPFTDVTTDAVGNFAGTIVAQGNGLQAGVGTLTGFNAVLTANFIVSQPQDVTFNIVADDGFMLGVGGGASRVSGTLVGVPASGLTPFNSYQIVGAYNQAGGAAPATYAVTVHFPSAGAYSYEIDYFECCGSQLSLTMTVASVNTGPYNLSTGYADTTRPAGSSTFPFPWNGAANTTFIGSGAPYDTGGLRFDNNTNQPITLNHVTADIGTHHYDPWNLNLAIPPNGTLILASPTGSTFDTSESVGTGTPSGGGSGGFIARPFATGFATCCGSIGPVGVAFDHAGNLFAMNYATGFLYKFGPAGGVAGPATQVNATSIQGCPAGLAFSRDGNHLYLAVQCNGTVLEIDQSTGVVVRTVASGIPAATGLATDPITGDLFVSEPAFGHDDILRIQNPGSAAPTVVPYTHPGTADGIAFGPDGTLYASVCCSAVDIIAGTNATSPGTIQTVIQNPALAGNDGIALLPPPPGAVGESIVVNSNNGFLVEIDNPQTSTPTFHNIVTGGSRGDFAAVGPDHCLYATQSDNVEKVTSTDGTCPFAPSICLTSPTVPQVHVTINGFTFDYNDAGLALSGGGIDGECTGNNESIGWQQIGGKGGPVNIPLPPAMTLALQAAPSNGHIVGQSQAFTVAAMDGGGHAVPNVAVQFGVSGANPQQLVGTTDVNGTATFSYTGSNAGTDTVTATAFISGLRTVSNAVSIQWTIPAPGGPIPGATGPAPPSVVINSPPDGSVVSQPVAITATIRAPPSSPIASWSVTYQNVSGGSTIGLASGSGNPPANLATFDPTGLAAGTYAITVNAATVAGGGASAVARVIVGNGGGTAAQAPPTISAPSPVDGTIVTKPVPITATITPPAGQTIASWSVFYQSQSQGTLVSIKKGTGSPPATLASFDPTVVPNDTYAIIVSATASGGGVQTATTTVAVSGNLKPGRYTTTYQDLSVPVGRFTMEVRRTYDSIDKSVGDFGVGWKVAIGNFRVSANRQLGAGGWTEYPTSCIFGLCFYSFKASTPHYVTVTFPDQHQEVFDFTPQGGAGILYWQGNAAFTARPGLGTTSTLAVSGDSSLSYDFAGNLVGGAGYFNPTRFSLTTKDGRVLILDTQVGLVSESDTFGNSLAVSAAGVKSTLGPTSSPTAGPSITFTRDSQGRISDINGPLSTQHVHYTYSSSINELQTVMDPNGNVDTCTYDAASGNLSSVTGPGNAALSAQTYDANGRLQTVSTNGGPAVTITIDPGLQQQSYTDPSGKLTTVLAYDSLGDVVQKDDVVTGQPALTSKYQYDPVGRVIDSIDPAGNETKLQYDESSTATNGNVISVSQVNLNRTWRYQNYNSFGEPGQIVRPDGTVLMTLSYDANTGAVLSTQAPGQPAATFTYWPSGQLKQQVDAGGRQLNYTFDSSGHVATIGDGTNPPLQVSMDPGGLLRSVTNAVGNQIKYDYWPTGQVKTETNGRNNSWQYFYDVLGRIDHVTDPLVATMQYHYNALGQLDQVTDRNLAVTTYSYDIDGNLIRETRPGNDVVNFAYDPLGHLIEADNVASHVDRSYDVAGRQQSETTCANTGASATPCPAPGTNVGGLPTVKISYLYWPSGQVKQVISSDTNSTVSYSYDANGNPLTISDPANPNAAYTYGYDTASRLATLQLPNGIVNKLTYGSSGDLTGIDASLNGAPVVGFDYQVDPVTGRRTRLTDAAGQHSFTYYANGAIKSETHPPGSGLSNQTYTYDAAGNRSAGSVTSQFDAADRLQTDGSFAYAFDSEGNLRSKTPVGGGPSTTYAWNSDHQLTSITYPDATVSSYQYDAFGRRIKSQDPSGAKAFAYDGLAVHADYDGQGRLQTSYLPQLEAVSATTPSYYLTDGLGSVRNTTDSSGSISGSSTYSAWGIPASTNATGNRYAFTGYQLDQGSGLYYAGSRYYDPANGRFLSEDPQPALNSYPYAANDPVNNVDVRGEGPLVEFAMFALNALNNAECVAGVASAITTSAFSATMSALGGAQVTADQVNAAIAVGVGLSVASCAANAATAGGGKGVQANRAVGLALEDKIAGELGKYGFTKVAQRFWVRTGLGWRVIDILAERNGFYVAFEIKSGGSVYLASQIAKDAWMARLGVELFRDGRIFQVPTILIRG